MEWHAKKCLFDMYISENYELTLRFLLTGYE